MRPKIHKCASIINAIKDAPNEIMNIGPVQDLEGRPIVAGVTSPTRHLSDLIGKLLSPLVSLQTTYVKDDWDYLRKLPQKNSYESNIFGCDIKSLYTSISHELGLKAIDYWLNKHRNEVQARFSNEFILESIKFLLTNNIFTFNNQHYKQLNGTAMGSSFASFYACLTIGYLEEAILFPELEKKFEEADVTKVKLSYKRYMDDGIVFLPTNMVKEDFLKYLMR